MASEDVVHVLRRFREALLPAGAMLDLQAIPPQPVVESEGTILCEVDGSSLLDAAAAAAAAVDAFVRDGLLVEEAVDDHDVRRHYPSGAALVEDLEPKPRNVPPAAVPLLLRHDGPVALRERCRLRRLRVAGG
jgi:hypothetical protein